MIGASVLGVQKILNARFFFFFSSAVHAVRVSRVSSHPFCDVCMCDDYISTIYTWRLWRRTWCTHTHTHLYLCAFNAHADELTNGGTQIVYTRHAEKQQQKQLHYVDDSIRRECLVAAAGAGWCRCVAKYPNDFLLIAVSSVCLCACSVLILLQVSLFGEFRYCCLRLHRVFTCLL